MAQIQDLSPSDAPIVLPLNNAHQQETSLLTEASLTAMLQTAFYARGIDHGATAFLLAFDQHAPYRSPNFLWFQARRESFIYIDRIIVDIAHRGRGLAKLLYDDVFAVAKIAGHHRVVCEVNVHPPNPASEAFHQAMDFTTVGEAEINNGTKTVSYLERLIP